MEEAPWEKRQVTDCNDAVHSLYHFLDGELTVEKRIAIQRHLDDCPPCFEAFDFEAELRQVIAQRCREQVPDALRLRIFEAIQQETTIQFPDPPGTLSL